MSLTYPIVTDDEPFHADVWRNVDSSLLWALRSIHAAEMALHLPVEELAAELERCPRYRMKVQEIFKMLLIEQAEAPARAERIRAMVRHVRTGLVRAGLDASGELMYDPIDYSVLPEFGGVAASDVNELRAEVTWGSRGASKTRA